MYTKKAELKVGVLVLAAIAILLGLLYFAGGEYKPWGKYTYWTLRFASGRAAPRAGDPVSLNGAPVGRVESVALVEEVRRGAELTADDRRALRLGPDDPVEGRERREVYVRAVVRTDVSLSLPEGTRGLIETNIAGVRSLHLVPGTSVRDIDPESTRTKPIEASEGAGLDSIAQQLEGTLTEIRNAAIGIDRLSSEGVGVLAEARELLTTIRTKVDAIDVTALNEEAVGTLRDIRAAIGRADERIGQVLGSFEDAGRGVTALANDGREALAEVRTNLSRALTKAESALESVDGAAKQVESLIADNGPKVSQFLDSMVTTGERLAAFAAELEGLGPTARGVLDRTGVQMDELLTALTDTAHNLFDASEDIRAHPWKLLNEPEADQIAFDNLRQSSHTYLQALRNVERTLARMEAAKSRLAEGESDPGLEQAITAFKSALDGYGAAEARWTRLFQSTAPRGGR